VSWYLQVPDFTHSVWGYMVFSATLPGTMSYLYEGESNENRKTEIKIRNIAPLSYKLADMLPML
jgi:hypothetical protein